MVETQREVPVLTPTQRSALNVLRIIPAAQVPEIAARMRDAGAEPFTIPTLYAALTGLCQSGQVTVRQGWYRINPDAEQ